MRTFSDFCIVLLRIYQRVVAPLFISLGVGCRFEPSCSHYTIQAVNKFGPFRGLILGIHRLIRCQPLCSGGLDPVPEQTRYLWRAQKNG